ncbi:Short transient receptor putative channel 1 [Desmophyllum pertusum]|uniref:Short transient receptor putative channel 1 n=1 Tax=Desmophyllum pertusum TaxID=174260 RepID=A0A9W9YZ23_9CNID|nr:Short transient receptor putative channel 1 [Desmophyllum pertusum]
MLVRFYTDWVVLLFIFGQLVDIIKEVYQQGKVRFFSNNWNYLAIATVTSFLLHVVIWWTGRAALIEKLDSMTWESHAKDQSYTIVLISEFLNSVNTIFWSLFGQIDPGSFKIAEGEYDIISKTGITLFGAFNLIAVLVALNMLIAILNDSYVQITANLDTEWKFNRTKLWLSWVYKESVLPPPFNLLYLSLPFLWVMKRVMTACCSKRVLLLFKKFLKKRPKSTWKVRRINEKERREVIRHLILRNLAKKSYHPETGTELNASQGESDHEHETTVFFANSGLQASQSNGIATMETTKM